MLRVRNQSVPRSGNKSNQTTRADLQSRKRPRVLAKLFSREHFLTNRLHQDTVLFDFRCQNIRFSTCRPSLGRLLFLLTSASATNSSFNRLQRLMISGLFWSGLLSILASAAATSARSRPNLVAGKVPQPASLRLPGLLCKQCNKQSIYTLLSSLLPGHLFSFTSLSPIPPSSYPTHTYTHTHSRTGSNYLQTIFWHTTSLHPLLIAYKCYPNQIRLIKNICKATGMLSS